MKQNNASTHRLPQDRIVGVSPGTAIVIFLFLFSLVSCSTTKKLPSHEKLYIGAEVKIEDETTSTKQEKAIEKELRTLVRPKPNTVFLGIRYKLMFYNLIDTVQLKKGLRYFIKHKLGEPPVLFSQVSVDANKVLLCNRLENRGYFHTRCSAETEEKKRKVKIFYSLVPGPQYHIRNVEFVIDSTFDLGNAVWAIKGETFLKSTDPYDLDVIKAERERIDARLKEKGFYYFAPDDILVHVDSTVGGHQVDLFVRIKPSTPYKARQIYTIANTYIFPDYSISDDTLTISDAQKHSGSYIYDPEHTWKPITFEPLTYFKPGDTYNRTDHNRALSNMVSIGAFKFVKNKFEETGDSSQLNVLYFLTPFPKKSIRAEISGKKTDADFTGTELTLNWRHRNTFRGAELLVISTYIGSDVQAGGNNSLSNRSYFKLGAQATLTVPRFLAPFSLRSNGPFVPKTRFTLGYDLLKRKNSYTLNSFRSVAGYSWKESIQKEHELNLVDFNYVQPINVTSQYSELAEMDATLKKAIEKQFTIGSSYRYTFTNTALTNKVSTLYQLAGIDLSGNILGLVTAANIKEGKTSTLFGATFSQYIKVEHDFRYYLKLGENSKLATRVFTGFGYAYGNSVNLPFVKQFFIGGSNSIRAFKARTIGPGSYYAPDDPNAASGFTADQSGDIKLEMSTEYRSKIAGIMHGAIFLDAGNIWLLHDDINPDAKKEGSLLSKNFINELLVGTGVGLRFDFSFVILRLDLAFPLRKSWLPKGERWVIRDIRFGNPQWRQENLVWNLAIGYPF